MEEMEMVKKEASRYERCNALCSINSIRENNFIEDSHRLKVLAEAPVEDATQKMFHNLEPCNYPTNSHLEATKKLCFHFRGLFRAIYLNQ